MGFRVGSYANVWSSEPVSEVNTKIRISISRKNKQSGEYEQDFGGFVSCIGATAAKKAAQLKEGDRIKLGDCDVSTFYNKEKKVEYVNYKLFDFEMADKAGSEPAKAPAKPKQESVEVEAEESDLPF